MQWLRRLLLAGVLAALGMTLYGRLVRDHRERSYGPAEWPPLEPAHAHGPTAAQPVVAQPVVAQPVDQPRGGRTLAETPPVLLLADGECPNGFPIKANDNSGIYHVPGGRFYDRTRAQRCYARAEDAEADGYRRAKA